MTQEQREDTETVVCFDWPTGKIFWRHGESARYNNAIAGEGPRATPTVDGGHVYAQGATGIVVCLDLATGALIWRYDVVTGGEPGGVCAYAVIEAPSILNLEPDRSPA